MSACPRTKDSIHAEHQPYFHAVYAEHEAKIEIATLGLLDGSLPRRAIGLVLEWSAEHRSELLINWDRARAGEPLEPIEPLD